MARTEHPATLSDEQLIRQCEVRRQRRSGPGGQHRNKVETGIFLKHMPTGVEGNATERRSQADNQRLALDRLRVRLAIHHRDAVADEDGPHDIWNSRCSNGRITVSRNHRDFAIVLAEALDFLAAADQDCSSAAERLGCTRSQLTKLLRLEPAALQLVNQERRRRQLPPLK